MFNGLHQRILGMLGDPEKQKKMSELWEQMMDGIQDNLETHNRERFTGQLTAFMHGLKANSISF